MRFDQTLQPLRSFQVSPGQSSWLGSPGHGMVWNDHTSFPVAASQARMSPRGCGGGSSPGRAPVMSRFLYTVTGFGTVNVSRRLSGTAGRATPT